jgi:hypothetical protein
MKSGPPKTGRPKVIASFFRPSAQKEIADAEVIMGTDEMTGNEFLVFGREVVREIIASNTSRSVYVVRVPILQATEELEALLAATVFVKGWHEYESSEYGEISQWVQ